MKKTDEPDTYGRNTLIERYRKAREEVDRRTAVGYAEAKSEHEAEEVRMFLAIREKMGEDEFNKWFEDGGRQQFYEDLAAGKAQSVSSENGKIHAKKLRPSQDAAKEAQVWADTHWDKENPVSNRKMAEDIKENVKPCSYYEIITIERWIKNYNPKRAENQRKHTPQSRKAI